jgi:steroid delta-isomerase-like uncharacterized protein
MPNRSENESVIRRLYEEFVNEGNEDAFYEIVAEDMKEHEEFPGLTPNREGVKEFFGLMRQAFPDLQFTVEDMLVDGEKVACRFRMKGTHRGEFMGAPPSNSRVEVEGIDIFRVANGQVKEHWGAMDSLNLMQQLGAIPSSD